MTGAEKYGSVNMTCSVSLQMSPFWNLASCSLHHARRLLQHRAQPATSNAATLNDCRCRVLWGFAHACSHATKSQGCLGKGLDFQTPANTALTGGVGAYRHVLASRAKRDVPNSVLAMKVARCCASLGYTFPAVSARRATSCGGGRYCITMRHSCASKWNTSGTCSGHSRACSRSASASKRALSCRPHSAFHLLHL